jgi:hypothetical protein
MCAESSPRCGSHMALMLALPYQGRSQSTETPANASWPTYGRKLIKRSVSRRPTYLAWRNWDTFLKHHHLPSVFSGLSNGTARLRLRRHLCPSEVCRLAPMTAEAPALVAAVSQQPPLGLQPAKRMEPKSAGASMLPNIVVVDDFPRSGEPSACQYRQGARG